MPVSLYHIGASALGKTTHTLRVDNVGAQVMGVPQQGLSIQTLGAQVLFSPSQTFRLQSIAAQVLFNAEVDPATGGYLHPERQLFLSEVGDMILTELIFPECISYGSTGSPRYETVKAEVQSGDETRQARWRYPKNTYNINIENLNAEELADVLNIWHICSGEHLGFLFLDPVDHTSSLDGAIASSKITSTDQQLDAGIGGQTNYPLYKFYEKNGLLKRRLIRYPISDTLLVQVNGIDTTQVAADWTNPENALAFVRPIQDELIQVNKTDDTITRVDAQNWTFQVGDMIYFDGFGGFDLSASLPGRVASVLGSSMTITEADGTPWGGTNDQNNVDVTFNHGLPATGQLITAGYSYYVPVRFADPDAATVELTGGQQEKAFANMDNIVLKEIFE